MTIYDNTGVILLDIEVNDNSVRNKSINGDNSLILKFSLDSHIEVPLGSYCDFKRERYFLMSPESITLVHRRAFDYELVMYGRESMAKRYKFVNPEDGRLKFPLTAKPIDHLRMFVKNMNDREESELWEAGECPDLEPVSLSYNFISCHDALVQLAEKLEMDYWFDGYKVNVGKLELNKEAPLPLSYGGDGVGLKANIKRTNYSEVLPVEVLYVQGGEKNIDFSKYGAKELHLPISQTISFDGVKFEDEEGFDIEKARAYVTDSKGYSVRRADKGIENHSEDSLDCTEFYATKDEVIKSVIEVDREEHYYDLLFASDVDYRQYQIAGETASIVFQTGMLAGKEFDLTTYDNGDIKCELEDGLWRIEIKPQEIDGIEMPDYDSDFIPRAEDKFKVFGIQLPDEYLSNPSAKTGAEWDMLRYAVKHFYTNEEPQYTVTGELDEIYAKRHWVNIEGWLRLGSFVSFSDKSFQEEPIQLRIVGLKEYVNRPYSPEIEFSNKATGKTLIGTLTRVQNEEVNTEKLHKESVSYTKRRFRSAQETLEMLQSAFKNFSEGISPVTVKTMAMLIGDESLQFKFTSSRSSLSDVPCPLTYDESTKQMKGVPASLIHMTLGIDAVTAHGAMTASDYKGWDIPAFDSAILDDGAKAYYVYVMADANSNDAEFILSDIAIEMSEIGGYYHFLVGILNSEYNGTRDFVTLYGFTEILPGQITTDVIRSADGKTIFDLLQGIISLGEQVGMSGKDDYLRIWAGATKTNRDTAPFKVFNDGRVTLESAFVKGEVYAEEGRIGPLNIQENGLSMHDSPDNATTGDIFPAIAMFIDTISFSTQRMITSSISTSISNVYIPLANTSGPSFKVSRDNNHMNPDYAAIEGDCSGGMAFRATNGMFAGLRPKTRVIQDSGNSTDPHGLTDLDHTIIVNVESGMTYLNVPSQPQEGQRYEIYTCHAGMDLCIYFNKVNAYSFPEGKDYNGEDAVFQANQRRYIELIYAGGQWWMNYRYLVA